MNVSEAVRRAFLTAIDTLVVDGVTIPVFDEFVNPNVTIPTLRGAKVYVVIQDQQEVEGEQNYCGYRQQCSITVRTVTKFNTAGVVSKRVSEDIDFVIEKKIKPNGATHSLVNANGYAFQKVSKEVSRSYTEYAKGVTVINKATIFQTTVNN